LSVFIGPIVGSMLAGSGMNLIYVIAFGAALRLFAAPLIQYGQMARHIHWGALRHAH